MPENGKADELTERLKKYGNTSYELAKLELIESSSVFGSGAISSVFISVVVILSVFFTSFGCAYLLSIVLKNNYLGFLIVGAFYFLLSLTLILGRKKLLEIPIRNKIIHKIYNEATENNLLKNLGNGK